MGMKIWTTSDWHFNHDKEFIYKPRGFSSIQEMNEELVHRHNEVVNETDIVYVLGDLMLGPDLDAGINLINQMNGRKIIILGNHDCTKRRLEAYREHGLPVFDALRMEYKGYKFFLCHYPAICSNYDDDKLLKARTISLRGHYHCLDDFEDMKKVYQHII